MSIQTTRIEGVWTPCLKCPAQFFRYEFGNKFYTVGDKIGICPICLFNRKIENGTLPKKDVDISTFVNHKSNDSKPEGDSL